jgi:uncharacterized membrane protein
MFTTTHKESQIRDRGPNPTDWGRGLAVSSMISGAVAGQGKLGQGDLTGALALVAVSLVVAIALAGAGRLITWLARR